MNQAVLCRQLLIPVILLLLLAGGVSPSRAYQQDLKKMAVDLAARIHAMKNSRVTVVDFVDLDAKPTKLGRFLAQQLQLNLAEPELKLMVVDQSQFAQLLDQVEKLNEGLLDPATGRKLGQMAGTEVIVLGTVMPSSMTIRLDIKAIDLQTAKLITGGNASLPRIGLLERLVNDTQGAEPASDSSAWERSEEETNRAKPNRSPARTRRDQGMVFTLDGCSQSSDELTCAVTVTSEDRDRWLSVTFDSRAWNEAGEEFGPGEVTIANSKSSRSCTVKQILRDVPTRLSMTFPNFGDPVDAVERLRLYWAEEDDCCCYSARPINFEKIPLAENVDFASSRATAPTTRGPRSASGGNSSQTGGGVLQRFGGKVLSVLESAATEVIEKKKRELVGDDENDGQNSPDHR